MRKTNPTYFATGAQHERALAEIQIAAPAGALLLAGGPLDAPCRLAGGSHNSTENCDYLGRPRAADTTIMRSGF